jgi:hypothetical protein
MYNLAKVLEAKVEQLESEKVALLVAFAWS